MALNFQGYGDPFAKQKMEDQQKQQQFQNLIQALGMVGNGVNQYQDRQRQESMDKMAKTKQQNEQFLFDRQYKPQEGGSNPFMGSDMSQMTTPMGDQGPQNKLSLFQGGQGQPQVSSDIVAMHKKMFPHFANVTDSGIPSGMSRADYEDQLKYDEQGAKTANLNAEAKKNAALANNPKSTSIDSILAEKVKNGEITLEDALKMKQQNSGGSFMMGGVGVDGKPVFYNTKDPSNVKVGEVPGGGILYPKTPSEGQQNSSLFGQRADEANQQLDKILSGGLDPTTVGTGSQSFLPNILQGSGMQSFEQAKRNFINAVLRKESGAAISPSEHKEANRQYFPSIGDKPEVLEQKKINRQTAIDGLNKMAGQLASPQNLSKTKKSTIPKWDSDKEKRYQEWKASHQ